MLDRTDVIRVMDALNGGVIGIKGPSALEAPVGRLVLAGRFGDTQQLMVDVCSALGWVYEPVDAVRTNLNDMDWDSPLNDKIVHAAVSETRTWMFVFSGVNERFLKDKESLRRLAWIATNSVVVILADAIPGEGIPGWGTLDLTASRKG